MFKDLSAAHGGKYFTEVEVREVLKKMSMKMSKSEVGRMLWEFDEDLNGKISER